MKEMAVRVKLITRLDSALAEFNDLDISGELAG
jgi:hypothetical protein